jgi:hypothetical protein
MVEPLGLGDGFIFEATDLKTGRVKAKLRPVSASWTESLSQPSSGSLVFATGDLKLRDVWPHLTGIYISRVIKNPGSIDTRQCVFAGFVESDAIPQSPETVSVGFRTAASVTRWTTAPKHKSLKTMWTWPNGTASR